MDFSLAMFDYIHFLSIRFKAPSPIQSFAHKQFVCSIDEFESNTRQTQMGSQTGCEGMAFTEMFSRKW